MALAGTVIITCVLSSHGPVLTTYPHLARWHQQLQLYTSMGNFLLVHECGLVQLLNKAMSVPHCSYQAKVIKPPSAGLKLTLVSLSIHGRIFLIKSSYECHTFQKNYSFRNGHLPTDFYSSKSPVTFLSLLASAIFVW